MTEKNASFVARNLEIIADMIEGEKEKIRLVDGYEARPFQEVFEGFLKRLDNDSSIPTHEKNLVKAEARSRYEEIDPEPVIEPQNLPEGLVGQRVWMLIRAHTSRPPVYWHYYKETEAIRYFQQWLRENLDAKGNFLKVEDVIKNPKLLENTPMEGTSLAQYVIK